MIIVSQDKEEIVNFDNVTNIYVTEDCSIMAPLINGGMVQLGLYPSLDRAKEILKEIYKYKDDLEHTKFLGYTEAFWKSTTFEMPEE